MTKVAFIMDGMFEDSEFRVPFDSVKEAGYEPVSYTHLTLPTTPYV